MKLLVEIDEGIYKNHKELPDEALNSCGLAIKHGTPLPKGHGRLIDADALWKKWVFDAIGKQEIDEAPTIIEADKESKQNLKR